MITADTDFGLCWLFSGTAQPSVILLRRLGRRAEQRADAVMNTINAAGDALDDGALVVVEPSRIRVRALPFDQP